MTYRAAVEAMLADHTSDAWYSDGADDFDSGVGKRVCDVLQAQHDAIVAKVTTR